MYVSHIALPRRALRASTPCDTWSHHEALGASESEVCLAWQQASGHLLSVGVPQSVSSASLQAKSTLDMHSHASWIKGCYHCEGLSNKSTLRGQAMVNSGKGIKGKPHLKLIRVIGHTGMALCLMVMSSIISKDLQQHNWLTSKHRWIQSTSAPPPCDTLPARFPPLVSAQSRQKQ